MNDNTSKKRVYWNRKMIALLIQLYKENECLYDKKHEDYNNRSEKGESLEGILKEMKKFLPQLQPEDISRKLKIVRSQFSYELGLIESAEAVGVTYESKLWFFQQLSFLRKHMSRVPPKRKNVSLNELSYDDDSDSNDGGKSLFEELAVDKNPSSQESLTGRRELRRRHIKIKWNNEITEKFINFLKNEPCLYDVQHEDFADRAKRAEARLRLVHDMQQFVPSMCLHDVLVKMRCLRNQYSREWRQIAIAAENNKKYKPRLWCFYQLSYLKAPHTYDGRSEIGEYEDTTRQAVKNTSNNEDTDISDTNDGIDTTNEEELELPTENDDEDDREERDEEIDGDELENSAIHEIPNENIPNKPQHFCFAGKNKKIDSKSAFKAETDQDGEVYNNYDWLGRLVVSQLDEISPSYRNEFAWDVQRLVRKYILKTKGEGVKDDGSSVAHGSKMPDEIKEFVLPRSSNVSLNISFT